MIIHGWGRYPRREAAVCLPLSFAQCADLQRGADSCLPRGMGRSYGDSSLAARVIETRHLDHFLDFDAATGVLTCAAGATLDQIIKTFVPRGWFLPVTPGTRFVTVGGAIASDVHGKNHHVDGCFGDHVVRLELLLGDGSRVHTSPTELPDLFRATCGGMGLTGIILTASIRLKAIGSSDIVETTLKQPNLESVLEAFEQNAARTYSVAWIDCLARGRHLGRSLLMVGEHATDGNRTLQGGKGLTVPFDMPPALLNRASVGAFNTLYYGKAIRSSSTRIAPLESFFYPLDGLYEWNRLYGRPGFLQYQFVIPREAGIVALRQVLERIAASGRGSFLAVLKVFGKANDHLLSFPCDGYTLALDFKYEPAVLELLEALDRLVLEHGGRLYLAKDARMSEATFKAGYPHWQAFQEVRAKYHALGRFSSEQSKRLGLQ